VLGGDWEGGEAIRAEDEEHRGGKGIQSEVGPVLGGRPRLEPWQGRGSGGRGYGGITTIFAQREGVWRWPG